MIHLTVRPDRATTQRHTELSQLARHSDRKARRIADSERQWVGLALLAVHVQIVLFWASAYP